MRTTITSPISHLCPHVDEVDLGEIEIRLDGPAPELHALRDFLESFHSRRITHEEMTQLISDHLEGAHVTTTWLTAGLRLKVECGA